MGYSQTLPEALVTNNKMKINLSSGLKVIANKRSVVQIILILLIVCVMPSLALFYFTFSLPLLYVSIVMTVITTLFLLNKNEDVYDNSWQFKFKGKAVGLFEIPRTIHKDDGSEIPNPEWEKRSVEYRETMILSEEIFIFVGSVRYYNESQLNQYHGVLNSIPSFVNGSRFVVCPAAINYLLNHFGSGEIVRLKTSGRKMLRRLGSFNVKASLWNEVLDDSVTLACAIRKSRDNKNSPSHFFV
jgi:hypothetical protein